MDFVVNGKRVSLTVEKVERSLQGATAEGVQTHGVHVGATVYPVKQALALATGLRREEFTSQTARRLLERVGFFVTGTGTPRAATASGSTPVAPGDPRAWPWEGAVQSAFAEWLDRSGWSVTGMADTATKAHGVDLLAYKRDRLLGAEVKGWPSTGYVDPRRAGEVKRTAPTNQAGHWFSHALMKAMMLLDSHPDHESLVVVPDYPRYRDLAGRTNRARAAAGIHVVFVTESSVATSDTWSP